MRCTPDILVDRYNSGKMSFVVCGAFDMASLWKRLRVVVVGFGIGMALSMFCALPLVTNPTAWSQPHSPHPASALLILVGPAAGPFAEPLAYVDYSLPRMYLLGGGLLVLIALHPCWPRLETGLTSGLTILLWFLLGFSYTYAGV
jgi:hypothetical protein